MRNNKPKVPCPHCGKSLADNPLIALLEHIEIQARKFESHNRAYKNGTDKIKGHGVDSDKWTRNAERWWSWHKALKRLMEND